MSTPEHQLSQFSIMTDTISTNFTKAEALDRFAKWREDSALARIAGFQAMMSTPRLPLARNSNQTKLIYLARKRYQISSQAIESVESDDAESARRTPSGVS